MKKRGWWPELLLWALDSDSEAEMIVPGDNILNLVLVENNVKRIKGIPVMDITGCLVKMAETLVDMKELGVVDRSKGSVIPKEELEKVRNTYLEMAGN